MAALAFGTIFRRGSWTLAVCFGVTLLKRQVLTLGTAATYTTPANCRQLKIRMVGGGGGGK